MAGFRFQKGISTQKSQNTVLSLRILEMSERAEKPLEVEQIRKFTD
jgi:hypothetical protein